MNVGLMDSLDPNTKICQIKCNSYDAFFLQSAVTINCVSKTDAYVNQIMYSIISVITCFSILVYSNNVIMTVIAINSTAKEFAKTEIVITVNHKPYYKILIDTNTQLCDVNVRENCESNSDCTESPSNNSFTDKYKIIWIIIGSITCVLLLSVI